MEIVGKFLGMDCDKSIWEYFKSHWGHFFPRIPDRSHFVRQAANLHMIKRMLQERLAISLGSLADSLHLIDSLPIPVCKSLGSRPAKKKLRNIILTLCSTQSLFATELSTILSRKSKKALVRDHLTPLKKERTTTG